MVVRNKSPTKIILSKLALKVPMPKRTGHLAEDTRKVLIRGSFQKIITKLESDNSGELVLHVLAMLESNSIHMKKTQNLEVWDDSYARIYKIPKYWLANLICKFTDISKGEVDLMDAHDSDSVKAVFEFFMQLKSSDPLPRTMLDKSVCAEAFIKRAEQVGNRWKGWKAKAFNSETGAVDWKDGGAYIITFSKEGIAQTVTHVGTSISKKLSEKIPVTREWVIKDNAHDMDAMISLEGTHKYLHEYFDAGEGPHLHKTTKQQNTFKELATLTANRFKNIKDALQATLVEEDTAVLRTAPEKAIQRPKAAQLNRKGARKPQLITLG